MRKIGIMGGTFNPIHIGHLALAESVLDDIGLDEVWLIPTGCSYMKKNMEIAEGEHRYAMTCLAIEGNDRMKCLDIEIKRPGYTYSYETLEQLKEQYPEEEFYFIFGADCLFAIENWKYPQRILKNCKVIAGMRNGVSITAMEQKKAELVEKFQADIILYPFLNLEISSTELRERIRTGKSIRYLVPDRVISYVKEKKLYVSL